MHADASSIGPRDALFDVEPPSRLRSGTLSPKRPSADVIGLGDLFPYYAGFSYDWAQSKLRAIAAQQSLIILDPWNGAGTTTLAAQANGLHSIGVDLNPVANIVARLRVTVGATAQAAPTPPEPNPALNPSDPLSAWLSPPTVSRLRAWTSSLQDLPFTTSSVAYTSLFRAIRQLTQRFEGSNPTWVRRASDSNDVIHIGPELLDELIQSQQSALVKRLESVPPSRASTAFLTASANHLPIANQSVDVILTSPPYLTRIDYAVAYARELAIIGVDIKANRALRENLMGTTLIRATTETQPTLGGAARHLLDRITRHNSRASSGYYRKQFQQYFEDLTSSLDEISRVAKSGATMVLVVQDSYYKEIPINLAAICAEEARDRGWKVIGWDQFAVNRNLTAINTAARAYPKDKVAETVLTLQKVSH